jgi:hypothetical protein
MPLQVVQARNDLLSKLGITDAALATALTLQDVVIALNGALQMLQTAGQDYFVREELTLTLAAGTATYNVPANLQSVLGPVRWNNVKPLRALTSEGEFDQFARIFLGDAAYGGGTNGDPIAYFVRYLRVAPGGDICGITIRLAPAPSAPAGTLVAEVVYDAPSYVVADLSSTAFLPVAQGYAESILLPIARMLITRSAQFSRPELFDQLQADGMRAMAVLGVSGGWPNVDQPGPDRKVEA